ncbi:MAG: GNAT family N-acetyltransferase, partial [Clostridia bacterium]|nr:GNAT family N-acetyltransferase [Clostridia bacterium]
MAQLKMYRFKGTPYCTDALPEGYSVSNYRDFSDKLAWCECCKKGLVADDADEFTFYDSIESWDEIDICRDVFFLDHNGEHIGTVTCFVRDDGKGDMHMVGIREDYRGRGLSKYLNAIFCERMDSLGVECSELTTDEWRKNAVKGYLSGGWLPVEYDLGMIDRWQAVLEEHGIDSVRMVYEDGSDYGTVYRTGLAHKYTFGVFGAGRGRTMMNYCVSNDKAKLVAVCDFSAEALDGIRRDYDCSDVKLFESFDEFIKEDFDCIVMANYATEHAPYAVKALRAGKNVLSEVLPCQTMKEAVELIEAVEETGLTYAYAENYCYMPAPKKIKELYRAGKLGNFEYGEGEYMHCCEAPWHNLTQTGATHWRNTMSAFYYCTHSMGPLVHITGLRPVKVVGLEVAYNDRMRRMGALGGPIGVEMVTMENGGVCKSLHGVGPSRDSIWYSVYGSLGRAESAREDAENGGVGKLYTDLSENPTDLAWFPTETDVRDSLSDACEKSGHGGSDYYVMHHLIEKLRGNKNADTVDVYEAMDMFLPGLFAYRSVLEGGKTLDIPNLRDPKVRELYRNDTACTDPAVAGDMLQPSYSKGNADI